MFYLTLSILVLFVGSGLFTFDEEGLIIICSILWIDAAGGLFKSALDAELISKVATIRSKFSWYIVSKKTLLIELLKVHGARMHLGQSILFFNNWLFTNLVKNSLSLTLRNLLFRRLYESNTWVLNFGVAVHHSKLIKILENTLSVAPFSFTLVRTPINKVIPSFYTYKSLFPLSV
jgi:hypothetical protein